MSQSTEPTFKSKRENIKVIKYLGGGAFGNVFKVKQQVNENESQNEEFAVKQISVEMYKFHFKNEVTPFSKILREVHLLQKMGDVANNEESPNQSFVVKLCDHWIEGEDAEDEQALDKSFYVANPNFSSSQPPPPLKNWLFIQMELCHMNLLDWLKKNKNKEAKENEAKLSIVLNIIEQLLQALSFIHNFPPNGVVHRDIKPDNIFLSFYGGEIWVKLGDFGLGRVLREDKSHVTTVTLGSARYKSPEMLKQDGYYDTKTDVFSMGLVILEIIVDVEGTIYGETNKDKVKTILDKLFHQLQVGKLDYLGDELKTEELKLELEIVSRMTKFEREKRWDAEKSLDYFQNSDKFMALLEKERKEARLIFYNVPQPTTPLLFGRGEQLKELSNFVQDKNTRVTWLFGPMSIGVTELASNFARTLKGEAHCIWLEYQTLTSSLRSLCQFLGMDSDNLDSLDDNPLKLLNEVLFDLCRRDSNVPIMIVFHDIFYTFEATEFVENLMKSDTFQNIGNSLKLLLITKFSPPENFKTIKVGPLDLSSSGLMIREGLPYINLDFDYYLSTFKDVASLAFCIPGLIRGLCDYMNSLTSTPYEMSLFDAIPFLMYDMGRLIKFQRKYKTDKDSFLSSWQKLREHLDFEEWEYKILQVLSFSFPKGRAESNILFEICKENLKFVVDFDQFEKFKSNVSYFNVAAFSGEYIELNPLVNEVIKTEFTLEAHSQNSLLIKLLELAKDPKNLENETILELFQNIWNWLAKENELRLKYLLEFSEFTSNLGGNWEQPPLNEASNRFACRAWVQHKFIELQKDFESLDDENSASIITVKCYEAVYNVLNDFSKENNNYLKCFIVLRIDLIENSQLLSSNLSKFLLELCCPLISNILLGKTNEIFQTDKDLFKSWILAELKIDEGFMFREFDFVIFSFLSILKEEEYKAILEIGEVLISQWFKDENFNQLIFVIVFICIIIMNDSFPQIPETRLLFKKLETMLKLDKGRVFKGMQLWKLFLFEKWPNWFANAIFISNRYELIINLLLSIISKSGEPQQEFFEKLREYYEKTLKALKEKSRTQSLYSFCRKYELILEEINKQCNELFESGAIPEFYRNYLKCEVNQCYQAANLENKSENLAEKSLVNELTPFLIGLAMFGNHPELGEHLDSLNLNIKFNTIFINENGYFIWEINDNRELNIQKPDSLDLVKNCLTQSAEICMPQIIENFSNIYTKIGGGVLVHLLLSPITAQYRKELLEKIKTFMTDEVTMKSVVILLSKILELNDGIYEINTIFDISLFLVFHILACEKFELGSYLLKSLLGQFGCHYEGRGKLLSIGEHFETSYNRGFLSLPALELAIFETCVELVNHSWEKEYANKCLNLLRNLMKFRLNAKFSTPFVTGENKFEQLDKILGYFKKLGIGDEMKERKNLKFSVNLASIIFMLCLDDKHFPGKGDDAVYVLEKILKYYLKQEDFYKMLSLGRSLGFNKYSEKFNLVWGKACGNLEVDKSPLSFLKMEEIVKEKLFDFKADANLNEASGEGDEEIIL